MAKKDYTNWDRKELIKEIDQLRKRKKYGLVWEDKPENVVEQCKTELPVLEEVKSKEIITDTDKPVNLLIEGDNYHALSVLNYTHKGKIDVIYIDPPYNTGNKDFVYNDQYVDKEDTYRHSKWLSFMEKRLKLAKNLLTKEGIIFISINDIEQAQIKMLCNEIFDEKNFLANLIWQNKEGGGSSDSKYFRVKHEYILTYAKNKDNCLIVGDEISNLDRYKQSDKHVKTRGPFYLQKLGMGTIQYSESLDYPITTPDNTKVFPKDNNNGKKACWRWSKKKLTWGLENDFIVLKKDKNNVWQVYTKQYLNCDNEGNLIDRSQRPFGVIDKFSSTQGTKELKEIDITTFSYPKPKDLIAYLISKHPSNSGIVLDFMAGSGTTGHAVMQLNSDDNGKRKFILCTNNELNGEGGALAEKNNDTNLEKYGICHRATYPRLEKVIKGNGEIKGYGGNLKYFKTFFVPADPTDKNKIALTEKTIEMLCIKEDTFEKVKSTKQYKIFRNKKRYTGIIFDHQAIDDFKKEIAKTDGKFSLYIFSLGDDTFDEEFEDMKKKVKLSPIPEAILRVYRRIFK